MRSFSWARDAYYPSPRLIFSVARRGLLVYFRYWLHEIISCIVYESFRLFDSLWTLCGMYCKTRKRLFVLRQTQLYHTSELNDKLTNLTPPVDLTLESSGYPRLDQLHSLDKRSIGPNTNSSFRNTEIYSRRIYHHGFSGYRGVLPWHNSNVSSFSCLEIGI
mgnify:CR=1 FL=1